MSNQMPDINWKFLESDVITDKIIAIVREVGRKLAKSAQVGFIENSTTGIIDTSLNLAVGYPGPGILFAELSLNFPDESWSNIVDTYFTIIQESILKANFNELGLFCGAAGVGMLAYVFFHINEEYAGLLTPVQKLIIKSLPKEISYYFSKLGNVEVQDYDVIYGPAGIGRYLLLCKDEPLIKPLLEDILVFLVKLTDDIEVDGKTVPGWYISKTNIFDKGEYASDPQGYFDCGVSHGIAGPLALLSISLLQGIKVGGQKEAIQKIAGWLTEWYDEAGMYWPCFIGFEEYLDRNLMNLETRDAWCYGAPGVARALWLAGCALNDAELQNLAIHAFDTLFTRPEATWKIVSPSFCHGFSGLLCLANLMYRDTGLERFVKYREQLTAKIIDYFNPSAPFGFYDYEQSDRGIAPVNKAGLLEGAAGIALTLLSVVKPIKTNWDAAFLVE